MDIYKEKTATRDFIKEFIIKNDLCEVLNNREPKFLNLEFSQSNLSLTEKQDINNILWKLGINYEKIKKSIKLILNINDLNEIEKIFI